MPDKKNIVVKSVANESIAQEAGIEEGDILLKINGSPVEDLIEYRYLTSDENLVIEVLKKDNEQWEIEIEKDPEEDLGIDFDDPFLNSPRRCSNSCVFCFIDQLPKGMRDTLYFKDDDSRLSFLQGNFVTLTNMSEKDIERIIKYKISPINVSVHTTNPELRVKMLNNKHAGRIMELLEKLSSSGIYMNCQIVLCPGINDGKELERTLKDLYTMYPNIGNVAIVPVGITKHRQHLRHLQGFDKDSAFNVVKMMEPLQEHFSKQDGNIFARLADEFYIMADVPLPEYNHYDDFEQLEDGIGMIRYFESAISEALEFDTSNGEGKQIAMVTGVSAANMLKDSLTKIEKAMNVKINVYPIVNDFFGEKITVTGLITAGDIIKQVKGKLKEDTVLISSSMLKANEDIFLDDVTVKELENELGAKIVVCSYTGDDFIDKIANEVI